MSTAIFRFERHLRTASSENYSIYRCNEESRAIAELDIHIRKLVHCTLILIENLEEEEFSDLLWRIEEFICSINESMLKYVIHAYQGEFIGEYGQGIFDIDDPVNKYDLNEAIKPVRGLNERFNVAKGQLTESAVRDYFDEQGFKTEKATPELDHKKVDVMGSMGDVRLFVQVKYGKIAEKTIREFLASVKQLRQSENDIGAVVAESFPNHSELLRLKLENEYGVRALFVHKYQIVNSNPHYKRVIG